jgi:hypothetical protein
MSNLDSMKKSQADTRKMIAELRAGRSHEVQLPLSGCVLKVRDLGLLDLAVTGKIPNTMLDLVSKAKSLDGSTMLKEHAVEFGELLNSVFKAAVIFPPVADVADDEHICADDFEYGDKMALFNWVNREATIVRPFRDESNKPMAATSHK